MSLDDAPKGVLDDARIAIDEPVAGGNDQALPAPGLAVARIEGDAAPQ